MQMIQLLIQLFQYLGGKAFFNFQIVSLFLSQHKQWKWKIAQAVIMNIAIFSALFISLIILSVCCVWNE